MRSAASRAYRPALLAQPRRYPSTPSMVARCVPGTGAAAFSEPPPEYGDVLGPLNSLRKALLDLPGQRPRSANPLLGRIGLRHGVGLRGARVR